MYRASGTSRHGTSPRGPPRGLRLRPRRRSTGIRVYLDFRGRDRLGKPKIEEKYGNLFEMYAAHHDENRADADLPAAMGGLVGLQPHSTDPRALLLLGEANFSG